MGVAVRFQGDDRIAVGLRQARGGPTAGSPDKTDDTDRRSDREMTLPGTCWAFSPLENPGISLRRGRRRGCAQPGDKDKASVRRQHRWLMRLSSERGAVSAVSGPLSGPEPCILGIF